MDWDVLRRSRSKRFSNFGKEQMLCLRGQEESLMTAHKVDNHIEIEEDDVRAGQTGMHVRYILMISVVLAVVAMWIVLAAT